MLGGKMKFEISMYVQEWHTIKVEANSIDEAEDKAYEHKLDGEPTYLEVDILDSEEIKDERSN
tara:strand:- start:63 stop:251 length:189 start_codon:yes stop_codon:yes gene_type:complete